MNKKLFYYMLFGFFFTTATGTLLHFSYELSGGDPLVGMFSPVNESPWEHLKLIFFPSFFYFLLGWPFFAKTTPDFINACFSGLLSGTFSVLFMFYTYTGILGKDYLFLDIFIFLLAAYLTYYLSYQLISLRYHVLPLPLLVFLIVLLLTGFFSFTYFPPALPLFSSY